MTRSRYFCGGSMLAVALSLGMTGLAYAADAPAKATQVEEVVVTGSYIAGTPTDAAQPVEVIGAESLKAQGNPTIVQLVKTIPASQSALGESNRYNGGAGTASINLRGFGASRTLTLMNGRRLADSTAAAFQGGGADLNFIPTAAIGRIEILKDGAAATYGSDAVGGVVNFITRRDLDGLELEGEYTAIKGSDGDYLANVAWGRKFDNGNILLTAGYRHRSRLDIHERDWAIKDFATAGGYNGAGGFTGAANPGFYVANSVAGTFLFRDNGCAELGGTLTNTVTLPNPLNGTLGQGATIAVPVPVNAASPQAASSVCRFQFSNFNDLVNREDHYQLYGEVNLDITDSLRFHGEAAFNRNMVPEQRLSPANLSTQFPTPTSLGGLSGSTATPGALNFFVRYNVPATNPGLIALRTTCAAPLTAAQCTAMGAAGGVDISQTTWRAIAFAGHPLNPDKADHQTIEHNEWRVSGGFQGDVKWFPLPDTKFDAALTYMEAEQRTSTNDLLVDRIQLALNGFGSTDTDPNSCTPAERANPANAGNAAVGCFFFNPFTNGVQTSAVNGAANPFFNAAAANNPHVVDWMYGNYVNLVTNKLFVADLVFTGKTGLTLPGGDVAWAAGTQWRYDRTILKFGDFNNYKVFPCVDSIPGANGVPVCQAPAGPIEFFGSNADADVNRKVYAFFGEAKVPVLDNVELNLAIRYENYEGLQSTTTPRVSGRWQVMPWLAFRASASSTFRAPTANQTTNACATGVANIGGQYRAVQTCGNPNLQPEKAKAYNVGAIVSFGGFRATVDYYKFNFKGELTAESASRMFATLFPAGTGTGLCGTVPALEARFAFAGGVCNAANVLRIDTFTVNGPATDTAGVDFSATYTWNDFLIDGSRWDVGVDATYLIEYKRGAFTLLGAPSITFAAPEDRAGLYDLTSQFFSYPQTRAVGYLSYDNGPLNVRWQVRYTEGTTPAFGTTLFQEVADASATGGYRLQPLGKSDDFWQHDLTVRYQLPWYNTVATFSVQNIFEADPPFVASNFNYDYTNGNPLGRTFKINLRTRF